MHSPTQNRNWTSATSLFWSSVACAGMFLGYPLTLAHSCANGTQLRGLSRIQVVVFRDTSKDDYFRQGKPYDEALAAAKAEEKRLTEQAVKQLREGGVKVVADAKSVRDVPCLFIYFSERHAEAKLSEYVKAKRAHQNEIVATTWSAEVDEGDTSSTVIRYAIVHFLADYRAGVSGFDGP